MDGATPKIKENKGTSGNINVGDNEELSRQPYPPPAFESSPVNRVSPQNGPVQGQGQLSPEQEIIQVDLTNPEDMLRKLEILNLTDEEEDELLKQAHELNRSLREELHKQHRKEDFTRSFMVSASAQRYIAGHRSLTASVPPPVVHRSVTQTAGSSRPHHTHCTTFDQSPYKYSSSCMPRVHRRNPLPPAKVKNTVSRWSAKLKSSSSSI